MLCFRWVNRGSMNRVLKSPFSDVVKIDSLPELNEADEVLASRIDTLGFNVTSRHIFLCADQNKPKCCNYEDGMKSWDFLKTRLRELKLIGTKSERNKHDDERTNGSTVSPVYVARTKADCFQVCKNGPIAVVYPDGTWYHSCTPAVLEEIIQSHLIRVQLQIPLMTMNHNSRESNDVFTCSKGVPVEKYQFNKENAISIKHDKIN